MPRRFIKTYLPDHHRIRSHKGLRFLGERLHHPGLWHLSRRSVAGGLSAGMFIAFIPTPGQMLIAGLASLWLRVNLPLAVAMVWVTNPVTMPPIFYFTYSIGAWLLHSKPLNLHAQLSTEWLLYNLGVIWQPMLLGSLVVGAVLAVLTYLTVSLAWRCYVVTARRRRRRRLAASRLSTHQS